MATESNQTAGATGPAAPPATPTRNRHSAGIQVSLLNGSVLELVPDGWQIQGFQQALRGALVYGGCALVRSQPLDALGWPPLPRWSRYGKPMVTVKGDDGVIWDWRGMREAR